MRTNEDIIKIIKQALDENNMSISELARRVDMSKSTISRYMNKTREFPVNKVNLFSKALNLDSEYILGFSSEDNISVIYKKLDPPRQKKVYSFAENELEEQNKVVSIEETGFEEEYVGQTAAGLPIEGQQPIPFIGAETVSLLVNGDSMEDIFSDGDIVEYHPQPELENGEIGVFAVNGGITLKKFKNNGDIRLESLNKKYEDIVIQETDDFNILGKVIL